VSVFHVSFPPDSKSRKTFGLLVSWRRASTFNQATWLD
jgi:hypothetical protein